ncbi:MAG: hypothetical protein IT458_08985 [Planctomycetes bacterium]|nr:hypothetical protein [Planctomycetota bacterium]
MRLTPLSAILLAAASVAAQSTVVPSAAATTKPGGSSWTSNVFYSTSSTTTAHASRSQSIYDVNDIAALAATWNSLQYRRPHGLGNVNPTCTTTAVIVLSVSANAPSAASSTFATNTGATPITVFNGTLNLLTASNPPSWPAPWEAPIPFSAPFPYARAMGASLVIDINQSNNSATTAWYLEFTPRDLGARATNGTIPSQCKFSNGSYNSSLSYNTPYVGSTWRVTYGSILPNAIGTAAIGAQGVGGSYGGLTLPIDLTPFGAPNCQWKVDIMYSVPLTASATGSASWPTLSIPNSPALGGQNFYDDALWLDPAANPWGVVTSWSSKWTIGTNTGAPAAMVYATGNSAGNPTGTLSLSTAPTFQLNP